MDIFENKKIFKVTVLSSRSRTVIIFVFVLVITLLHYLTARNADFHHVIYRELYFLPIMLAALWFGLYGGLLTSLLVSTVYGPFVFLSIIEVSAHDLGNFMEIILFNFVGGLLGWIRDKEVSQQVKLQQSENLASLGRAVSIIAHDLKTPLVSIGGLSNLLARNIPQDSPHWQKVNVIRQQSCRLEKLVMEMLDFAKPLSLCRKDTDIYKLLSHAREAITETALRHEVRVELPEEVEVRCYVDGDRMLQVLINLLSNAIEASPGGATVHVSIECNSSNISIEVTDRGEGIPEEKQKEIFEPFVSFKKQGTGLGLPIVRKIIDAHDGTIEIHTPHDTGVVSRILLPR